MTWANGEDFAEREGRSDDSGSVSLGLFLKIFIVILTGVGTYIGLEVISHGKQLASIDEKFKYLVEAVARLERKADSNPTVRPWP